MTKEELVNTIKAMQKEQEDMRDAFRLTKEELNRNVDLVAKLNSQVKAMEGALKNIDAAMRHHVNSESIKVGGTF